MQTLVKPVLITPGTFLGSPPAWSPRINARRFAQALSSATTPLPLHKIRTGTSASAIRPSVRGSALAGAARSGARGARRPARSLRWRPDVQSGRGAPVRDRRPISGAEGRVARSLERRDGETRYLRRPRLARHRWTAERKQSRTAHSVTLAQVSRGKARSGGTIRLLRAADAGRALL
jgi:hypothetical protein